MSLKKNFFVSTGVLLWTLTAVFTLLPSWPHLYYRLSPQTSDVLASTIAGTNLTTPAPLPTLAPKLTPTPQPLPEKDSSLPLENGLIIDKIGVRGQIHEGSNWQDILRLGIWRVPDFGTPEDTGKPIIIAAHRWGYLEWSTAFRKLNSFYHLPKLKPGDSIKLVWNQRQYTYTVKTTETGTEIQDYQTDLILYTCQLWNSPVRFFVYASLQTP